MYRGAITYHIIMLSKISRRLAASCLKSVLPLVMVLRHYSVQLFAQFLEYACPVWHCGLTQTQIGDNEAVQKTMLKNLSDNDDALRMCCWVSTFE